MHVKLSHALVVLALVIVAAWVIHVNLREPASAPAPTEAVAPPAPAPAPTPTPPESHQACQDLFRLACSRTGLAVEDPTGTVQPDIKGEVEALRLYEKLIHEHHQWTSDQVDEELVRKIYTEKRRHRLIEVFEWVVQAMRKWLDAQPNAVFSQRIKETLKKRLTGTILQLPPPASVYAGEMEIFTENDVYYEALADGKTVIRVGGAYLLSAKSRFNRVFTFAHELAHSIDPCEMQRFKVSPSAYRRLARCLTETGFIKPLPDSGRCGPDDQLSEVFADWVAVQITAEAIRAESAKMHGLQDVVHSVVSSVRDLCNQESWVEYETLAHPDPRMRIGDIFGKNPAIRELLGCQSPEPVTRYCELEGG